MDATGRRLALAASTIVSECSVQPPSWSLVGGVLCRYLRSQCSGESHGQAASQGNACASDSAGAHTPRTYACLLALASCVYARTCSLRMVLESVGSGTCPSTRKQPPLGKTAKAGRDTRACPGAAGGTTALNNQQQRHKHEQKNKTEKKSRRQHTMRTPRHNNPANIETTQAQATLKANCGRQVDRRSP